MSDTEPRTHIDITRDLLEKVIDGQWSGRRNTGCHCHPEYEACCPTCSAFETVPHAGHRKDQAEDRQHEADCGLYDLIEEARAFLRAENEVRDARDEGTVYVP